MNTDFSRSRPLSVIAVAVAATVATGCGGGGENLVTTTLNIKNAGDNGPFVGVTMTATCANNATSTGVIGTSTAPGDGTIALTDCEFPVKIVATGTTGKVRPLGAKADGTQDAAYNSAIGLSITNVVDTAPGSGSTVTANPVTTLVRELTDNTAMTSTEAKTRVESALGLTGGDASHDFSDPDMAAASNRLSVVTSLAAKQLIANGTNLQGKAASQVVADALGTNLKSAATPDLTTAAKIAAAIKGTVDVTADAAVTGYEVDNDATRVYNMVYHALNMDNHATSYTAPSTWTALNDLLTADANVANHLAEVNLMVARNQFVSSIQSGTTMATAMTTFNTASTTQHAVLDPVNQTALTRLTPTSGSDTSIYGCEITVPNSEPTQDDLLTACYSNLQQSQCSTDGIKVIDLTDNRAWNRSIPTFQWMKLTLLSNGKYQCPDNYTIAKDYTTVPLLSTHIDPPTAGEPKPALFRP